MVRKYTKKSDVKDTPKRGRPSFVPTDQHRAIVKLLAGHGISEERIIFAIREDDGTKFGSPISLATLKRHFAHELTTARSDLDQIVLTEFHKAIREGKQWALERHMSQKMWREGMGSFREAPRQMEVGGPRPSSGGAENGSTAISGDGMSPLSLIVQFEPTDPTKKPKF